MCHFSRTIFSGTGIFPSILHHNVTYIDMGYDVAVHRYILTNDESWATINAFFILKKSVYMVIVHSIIHSRSSNLRKSELNFNPYFPKKKKRKKIVLYNNIQTHTQLQ